MGKMGMILGTVLLLWAVPAAATIVIMDDHYASSAAAYSNLYGTDSEHQEGEAPVSASANIQGPLADSAAWAHSELLAVASGSAVTVIQPADGQVVSISLANAANAKLTVESDTMWTLDVEASSSTFQFGNTSTQTAAMAKVFDSQDNPVYVYDYDLSLNGPSDSYDFPAGEYKLLLVAASVATAGTCPDGRETATAESTVELRVDLIPLPEPATITLLGFSALALLRRRNRGI